MGRKLLFAMQETGGKRDAWLGLLLGAGLAVVLLAGLLSASGGAVSAAVVVREQLAPGVFAAVKGGRVLYLECSPPGGDAGQAFLAQYLAVPGLWKQYRNRMSVAIPYAKLNGETRRALLVALFPEDVVDEAGWWHVVVFDGEEGLETWWALAEWLTGMGTNYREIMGAPENRSFGSTLERGQRVLIPRRLLLDVMKTPTAPRETDEAIEDGDEEEETDDSGPVVTQSSDGELAYGSDAQGQYGVYRLKKGEALYTSVVVRFTDFRDHKDILHACDVIQERSGIKNVRRMGAGQRILIPAEMLSDPYQPVGSEQRQAYEAVRQEARRLKAERVLTKDLEGVVVILDAGHGGRDHGAAVERLGLYEDELNYDIVCRAKQLLEAQTQARVYVTVEDKSQGNRPSPSKSFRHDRDEEVLTTPRYPCTDGTVSTNLRWYVANDIYRKERAKGTDERKILFVSIHCDALYDGRLRGTMVYVPGAKYRNGTEHRSGKVYERYAEARGNQTIKTTATERRRDEALSRNFAATLLDALRHHDPKIKVHNHNGSEPVRNVIRQSGGRAYVPAVLRYNLVPTKVLVETANMTNATDQKRLADPEWREWFAEALVDALKEHYES